jgi:uncharacterized repeat protein (TIGR04138 family)
MQVPKLDDLVRRDPRYAYEAYEFLFAALAHTQRILGRDSSCPSSVVDASASSVADASDSSASAEEESHVSGQQLLLGIRDLALREFGLMARTVFRMWGINQTDDIGEIVFNLIDAQLMSKTSQDNRRDFHAVYDLDEALERSYQIEVPQEADDA